MIEIGGAVKAAEELDKAVGIIAKLVSKLKGQPDLAAQKLAQALGEVAKTLQVVDNAATEFLSLGIDEGALEKNSKRLLDIDGGRLSAEVERGRGHCHIIGEIYWKYLDRWFQRVFQENEYDSVRTVFMDLGNADNDLFRDLASVASKLEEEAGHVLNLVVEGDNGQGRARVLSALPVLRPLRRTMSKTMQTLYAMQSDFVDMTGAV